VGTAQRRAADDEAEVRSSDGDGGRERPAAAAAACRCSEARVAGVMNGTGGQREHREEGRVGRCWGEEGGRSGSLSELLEDARGAARRKPVALCGA
jgi:hypothetical protein